MPPVDDDHIVERVSNGGVIGRGDVPGTNVAGGRNEGVLVDRIADFGG